MKHRYLACYGYGTGGIWLFVLARSKHEIAERYPRLTVVDRVPAWMSAARQAWIAAQHSVDIDEQPPDWLVALMAERTAGD